MLRITVAGISDIGNCRSRNEDAYDINEALGLFVVADGIGGRPGGDMASATIAEAMPSLMRKRLKELTDDHLGPQLANALRLAIRDLDRLVCDRSGALPEWEGMGSTIVACLIRDDKAIIAHKGDSRAYLLSGKHLERLTTDHNVANDLLRRGAISEEEAELLPSGSHITRFVGMGQEIDAEISTVSLEDGDKLLLCTDGLTGELTEQEIIKVLAPKSSPLSTCQELIAYAKAAGGKDNITAITFCVTG
ncbi:MAG: serine/threonine-protein phosphatase [Chlorobiaceae bacterium]|nr:serine/threonine-protein phosphatase [Chlorobiaceae bacterium]